MTEIGEDNILSDHNLSMNNQWDTPVNEIKVILGSYLLDKRC